MEIIVSIPEWFARRGLRMGKPDKRLLVWFLSIEEHLWTARQTLLFIDEWRIQNGSPTWERWVRDLRRFAEDEEDEPIPDWMWQLVRSENRRRARRRVESGDAENQPTENGCDKRL